MDIIQAVHNARLDAILKQQPKPGGAKDVIIFEAHIHVPRGADPIMAMLHSDAKTNEGSLPFVGWRLGTVSYFCLGPKEYALYEHPFP